jgi:mRNA interferase MazF
MLSIKNLKFMVKLLSAIFSILLLFVLYIEYQFKYSNTMDVYLVDLTDRGLDVAQLRPCIVLSSKVFVSKEKKVIVAPVNFLGNESSYHIPIVINGRNGVVLLEDMRSVDGVRLVKHLGSLSHPESNIIRKKIKSIFDPIS